MLQNQNENIILPKKLAVCLGGQCAYLDDFNLFIRKFQSDLCKSGFETDTNNGVDMKSCVTRGHNESYTLTKNVEVQAEVLMQLWQLLDINQCPEHFKISLLRLAELEVFKGLDNADISVDILGFSNNDNSQRIYDSIKLHKFIIQWFRKVLSSLLENSNEENLRYADCSLNASGTIKFSFKTPYVHAYFKNKPRKMEDRHIALPRYSEIFELEEQFSFYGVFDGHSGSLAAAYVSNLLPYLISKQLKRDNKQSNIQKHSDYYREAFENAFLEADKNFGEKSVTSGTTAVCVLLKHNENKFEHLYVAWVGDSKALLVSPTMHLQLVKPHKPDATDERKRIESHEMGSIMLVHGQWRINGIINVSRSIGDHSVKTVIAEPDFVDVPIQTAHDFLILGSDGLWDHVTEQLIVQTVYSYLMDNTFRLEDIPKRLIELAKEGESKDNITIILVLLKQTFEIAQNYSKHYCV